MNDDDANLPCAKFFSPTLEEEALVSDGPIIPNHVKNEDLLTCEVLSLFSRLKKYSLIS